MFLDEKVIECRAGKGGDGCRSFRREKYIDKGGPDGGNGARGGHIILKAAKDLHTLYDLEKSYLIKSQNGQAGGPKCATGRTGEDLILKVPIGTIIKSFETEKIEFDLQNDGDTCVVAKGGKGGKGNTNFKSSRNKAPQIFTVGTPGELKKLKLELKLMADCGFVGLPNAGKSSLLNTLSNATPKVADYAFTTLQPYLGLVELNSSSHFILADIPGLIEGAAHGKGLGNRFLRHIERTTCLAFVIDITVKSQWSQYQDLLHELKTYQPNLLRKEKVILLNKSDLGDYKIEPEFKKAGCTVIKTSAFTGEGLQQFKTEIVNMLHGHSSVPSKEW